MMESVAPPRWAQAFYGSLTLSQLASLRQGKALDLRTMRPTALALTQYGVYRASADILLRDGRGSYAYIEGTRALPTGIPAETTVTLRKSTRFLYLEENGRNRVVREGKNPRGETSTFSRDTLTIQFSPQISAVHHFDELVPPFPKPKAG